MKNETIKATECFSNFFNASLGVKESSEKQSDQYGVSIANLQLLLEETLNQEAIAKNTEKLVKTNKKLNIDTKELQEALQTLSTPEADKALKIVMKKMPEIQTGILKKVIEAGSEEVAEVLKNEAVNTTKDEDSVNYAKLMAEFMLAIQEVMIAMTKTQADQDQISVTIGKSLVAIAEKVQQNVSEKLAQMKEAQEKAAHKSWFAKAFDFLFGWLIDLVKKVEHLIGSIIASAIEHSLYEDYRNQGYSEKDAKEKAHETAEAIGNALGKLICTYIPGLSTVELLNNVLGDGMTELTNDIKTAVGNAMEKHFYDQYKNEGKSDKEAMKLAKARSRAIGGIIAAVFAIQNGSTFIPECVDLVMKGGFVKLLGNIGTAISPEMMEKDFWKWVGLALNAVIAIVTIVVITVVTAGTGTAEATAAEVGALAAETGSEAGVVAAGSSEAMSAAAAAEEAAGAAAGGAAVAGEAGAGAMQIELEAMLAREAEEGMALSEAAAGVTAEAAATSKMVMMARVMKWIGYIMAVVQIDAGVNQIQASIAQLRVADLLKQLGSLTATKTRLLGLVESNGNQRKSIDNVYNKQRQSLGEEMTAIEQVTGLVQAAEAEAISA